MKINLQELKWLVRNKYVVVQKHPEHDLYIYNYSQKTQYERYWTPLTLMCRGLILDDCGNIVAKGLNKFFNYEELEQSQIPEGPFDVYEKYDGSYICIFKYNGELIVASRGSFTSDHAIYTKQLIEKNNYKFPFNNQGEFCLIFELIAKWNRIVCDYGDNDELILLAGFWKSQYKDEWFEYDWADLGFYSEFIGCKLAKKYGYLYDYKDLKDKIADNKEGFVIRFENGFRMKIKGEQYIKLHKIVTQISSKTIWESLMNGDESFQKMIENTPDEFMGFVKEQTNKLELQFKNLYNQATGVFKYLQSTYNIDDRKTFATQASNYGNLSGLLFGLYDCKDIEPMIWKRLEPKYEQPFKNSKNVLVEK